ncbi:hypothetical protein [Isoptericola sediminis]|uniref:DUF3800 domain-containing protein n=1 Tax=Isoptericola sediminis TaxID=2733572 RepID=A0A849K1E7_9MICO|nr:hypothetical protein [Isoptericola sediminis]NNU28574.1 hypothetical protein [Isoptericola sediminis]
MNIEQRSPRRGHVFVDESKRRDYLLVAAVVVPREIAAARQVVRGLMLPGQRGLHMVKESQSRQRKILSALEELDASITLYRAGQTYRTELERREVCLRRLVEDMKAGDHARLLLERDETLVRSDRKVIQHEHRRLGCTFRYDHDTAAQEPLLCIPDAVAWAFSRGGDFRRRAEQLTDEVVDL